MGAGASLQQRCRKALVIRAYNTRPADQSLQEQFSSYCYLKNDGIMYTNVDLIKQCLKISGNEYSWMEALIRGLGQHNASKNVTELRFDIFLSFLETGEIVDFNSQTLPDAKKKVLQSPGRNGIHMPASGPSQPSPNHVRQFPPVPPTTNNGVNVASSSSNGRPTEVHQIDLSKVDQSLPAGVYLHTENPPSSLSTSNKSNNQEDDHSSLEVIIRPSDGKSKPPIGDKQLWRKREVVRHEKSVYYTTFDAEGGQQELVEKETTQTEVLHMECRNTGEFAHKEVTSYEQLETFNGEVVNELHGAEEYVHLKSLEDEIHYMDSTMPPKEHEHEPEDHPKEPPPERQEQPVDEDSRHQQQASDGDGHARYEQESENRHDNGHETNEQQENQKPKKNRDYLFEQNPSLDETEQTNIPDIAKSQHSAGVFYETQRFTPSDLQPPQPSTSKGISRRNSQESLHDIDE